VAVIYSSSFSQQHGTLSSPNIASVSPRIRNENAFPWFKRMDHPIGGPSVSTGDGEPLKWNRITNSLGLALQ